MDVRFLRQIATPAEVSELREWLNLLLSKGLLRTNIDGEYRYYRPLSELPAAPPPIDRFGREIKKQFGIDGKCIELKNAVTAKAMKATPSFIGMQVDGGFVHPHVDGNIGEMLQFRCTLLINKPEKGGCLMLGAKEYEMAEGDMYCFISNATIHGTTMVQGDRPRMACSLGFLVDKSFRLDTGLP